MLDAKALYDTLLPPSGLPAGNNNRPDWMAIVDTLDFAFQPIVNIHTGVCLGYEALVRNWAAAGFSSIQQMFDAAYLYNKLAHFEYLLREKAIRKYVALPHYQQTTFFLNLDNRILHAPDEVCGNFSNLLAELGIQADMICLEISEKHPITDYQGFCHFCQQRKSAHFKVAIDDFGSGFSGLQLLYFAEPNFIKIDRFFINDIATDAKKKLFVSKVLNLAHILGSMVIAEGVETEQTLSIDKLLEVFSLTRDPEGIMLTNNGKYVGFLSNTAIIKILNEKNLAIARDQNPLSKMPGNSLIGEFLARAYDDKTTGHALIY
ncbi:MAG: EAL domain-containing protein, partial [Deltaproteobacteria bacterium]|nr:EAL domain-containing protein [Deltaproteobacteria bacterium]